jgi:hypothetical protein
MVNVNKQINKRINICAGEPRRVPSTTSEIPGDYLCTLDELNEISTPREDQDTSWGCSLRNQARRSSAVSGMGVLALE